MNIINLLISYYKMKYYKILSENTGDWVILTLHYESTRFEFVGCLKAPTYPKTESTCKFVQIFG